MPQKSSHDNILTVETLPKTPRGEPENNYPSHIRKYDENSAGSRFKTGTSFEILVQSNWNRRGFSNREPKGNLNP